MKLKSILAVMLFAVMLTGCSTDQPESEEKT